jgi:hypothetical protein
LRVLLWYAHGSYVNALVRGSHEYLVCAADPFGSPPPVPTSPWPESVTVVGAADVRANPPDVVVIQRLEEIDWCRRLLGFEPGRDRPAIFCEHNVPRHDIPSAAHPLADRNSWLLVHVTGVNAMLWDSGRTPSKVVGHGVLDPGARYVGDLRRAAFVVNEPVRRCRLVGTDLIPIVAPRVGVDVFGIDGDLLVAAQPESDLRWGGNLSQPELWNAVARDRVYLHLNRWTSLGLSLIEAMLMAMPVAVLAMTEAASLPPEIGIVSSNPDRLRRRVQQLIEDPEEARRCGLLARSVALERFGLAAFLRGWDEAYEQAVEVFRHPDRPVR